MARKKFRLAALIFLTGLLSQRAAFSSLQWIKVPSYPVALTFDDGPRSGQCVPLLNILKKYDVKATFFVVGKMAAQDPTDIRRMVQDGHEVANHTWSHPAIQSVSSRHLKRELDRTRKLIDALTGHDTWLFRAPGGTKRYLQTKVQVPRGYRMILWDLHSGDQMGISNAQIEQRVLSSIKSGDIVLMHNGLKTTMAALDHMIPVLKARGFRFVTVSELERDRYRRLIANRNVGLDRG